MSRIRRVGSAVRRRTRALHPRPAAPKVVPEPPAAQPAPPASPATPEPAPEPPRPVSRPTARLTGLRWITGDDRPPRLEITGYAFREGSPGRNAIVTLSLEDPETSLRLPTRQLRSELVNLSAGDEEYDRSDAAFTAELDLSALSAHEDSSEPFERRLQVNVSVADESGEVTGPFGSRDRWGAAGEVDAADVGLGRLARPEWSGDTGLVIRVTRRAVVAEQLTLSGTRLEAVAYSRPGFAPRTALLERGEETYGVDLTPLPETGDGDRYLLRADLSKLDPDAGRPSSSYLQLEDDAGDRRFVHWQGSLAGGHRIVSPADGRIAIRFSPTGLIRVDIHPRRLAAEQVEVDPEQPSVTISGECHELSTDPQDWQLVGGRVTVPCDRLQLDDGRFSATFGLRARTDWTDQLLPIPSGGYRLRVTTGESTTDAVVAPVLSEKLGEPVLTSLAEVRPEVTPRRLLHLRVRPPVPATEVGRYNQARLLRRYRTTAATPEDAVYFESFLGKSANDNTLAICRELQRRRPDLQLRWGVADLSIELPDGVEPVLLRSSSWWQHLADSRYIVTNAWMPTAFEHRPHQRVLQTWHGTPLKLLGFDRIGTNRGEEYRTKTLREVGMWDQLIAQNPYSAEIFRRAYGYANEVLEIGYPRNDVLSSPQAGAIRDRVRGRLGLSPDDLAVLYVPTWRENAKGLFRELDFDRLVDGLGPDARLLVRGHSNTIRSDRSVSAPQVLDLTIYPDLAELYLAADVMITDYSSTMFDFSITGKPMIFFAPDLEHYAETLRGTYFDLAESAPGPVLQTTDEVVDALRDLDQLAKQYADAYADWQRRFNPYDDGHATQRAVDALLR